MQKLDLGFWDYGAIAGALLVIIWALLKSLNIIHSPSWIEAAPYFGIAFSMFCAMLGFTYKLGKVMRTIEEMGSKLNRLLKLEERFVQLEHEHNMAMTGKLKTAH